MKLKALLFVVAATAALGCAYALLPASASAIRTDCTSLECDSQPSGTGEEPDDGYCDYWGDCGDGNGGEGVAENDQGQSGGEPNDGYCEYYGDCGGSGGDQPPSDQLGYGDAGSGSGSGSPTRPWEPKDGWDALYDEEWWQSLSEEQREEYEQSSYIRSLINSQLYNLDSLQQSCEVLGSRARSAAEYGKYWQGLGELVGAGACWLKFQAAWDDFIQNGPRIPGPGRPTRPDSKNKPPPLPRRNTGTAKHHRHLGPAHRDPKR